MAGWLTEALGALAASTPASFLRESTLAYILLNAAHILSLALVVGAIVTLDLRVLGCFARAPLAALARPLATVAAAGAFAAALTGFFLFSVRPLAYAANPAFLIKLSLVTLGLGNALALRVNRHWQAACSGQATHGSVRAAAVLSLVTWTAAVLAGRWIGFLQ